MKRLTVFIYGIFAYLFGLSVLIWFLLFVGSWDFLPSHIDSMQTTSLESALIINISLAVLFALQHSIMARQSFKKFITKFILAPAERSTYVLISGVFLSLICIYWQGVDGYLWQVDNQAGQGILISIYIFGWTFSVVSSFLINHFELFGLEQVYLNLKNRVEPEITFKENSFYKFVRHPIQLGTLIGIWATPNMSYTHLMLSVIFTIYILVGLHFEEKDLAKSIGEKYRAYQKRVPMIIPFVK